MSEVSEACSEQNLRSLHSQLFRDPESRVSLNPMPLAPYSLHVSPSPDVGTVEGLGEGEDILQNRPQGSQYDSPGKRGWRLQGWRPFLQDQGDPSKVAP